MKGFSIDTIVMYIGIDYLVDFNFNDFNLLINASPKRSGKFKDGCEGRYKNFHIIYSSWQGIYISGSISNFYVGNSTKIAHSQIEQAISELSYELGINLHTARLFRVDIALDLILNHKKLKYSNNLFTDLSRFKRFEKDEGLLFSSRAEAICIYDKKTELKKKHKIIIEDDVIRIEHRFLKNLKKSLSIENMVVEDLYSLETYMLIISKFKKRYDSIKKQTVIQGIDNMEQISPSEFKQYLNRNSIENIYGSESNAYNHIEQYARDGKFKNANDKCRCRKIIKDYSTNKSASIIHPMAKLINHKVEKAYDSAMNSQN